MSKADAILERIREGGRRGGRARRGIGRQIDVAPMARVLLAQMDARNVPSVLARRFGISVRWARAIVRRIEAEKKSGSEGGTVPNCSASSTQNDTEPA